jgi:Domain of unknown function (DUF6484)
MGRNFPKLVSPAPAVADSGERALQIGSFVGLNEQARPLVRLGSSLSREPVVARCTVTRPAGPEMPLPVLLFLEDGDAARPIIVGFVTDTFAAAEPLLEMHTRPSGATLDGKRLEFEASEEVVLKCGKGSITLQAHGRVVIKGTELVSRASGGNKIRGASVSIN